MLRMVYHEKGVEGKLFLIDCAYLDGCIDGCVVGCLEGWPVENNIP